METAIRLRVPVQGLGFRVSKIECEQPQDEA